MKETKSERFVRIVEARVGKLIKMLRLLGNCAHLGNYEYTGEQVTKIFSTLQDELDKARRRFLCASKEKKRFSLSDDHPVHVPEQKFHAIYLDIPKGCCLISDTSRDEDYPGITIRVQTDPNLEPEAICFVEFNKDHGKDGKLCVGAYTKEKDEPAYYAEYDPFE